MLRFLREALAEFGLGDPPDYDGERCFVCNRALLTSHKHGGVWVLPAPIGPRPPAQVMPRREVIEVRIVE